MGRNPGVPHYRRIADTLIAQLGDEARLPDRLPSERALAHKYGVARNTARRALEEPGGLEREGPLGIRGSVDPLRKFLQIVHGVGKLVLPIHVAAVRVRGERDRPDQVPVLFREMAIDAGQPQRVHAADQIAPNVFVPRGDRDPVKLVHAVAADENVKVTEIGNSSLRAHYTIRRKRDGVICFEADITTVLINLDTHASQPIGDELRTVLTGLAGAS